eukprot:853390-Pleurochrysis_carterae.AAC.2
MRSREGRTRLCHRRTRRLARRPQQLASACCLCLALCGHRVRLPHRSPQALTSAQGQQKYSTRAYELAEPAISTPQTEEIHLISSAWYFQGEMQRLHPQLSALRHASPRCLRLQQGESATLHPPAPSLRLPFRSCKVQRPGARRTPCRLHLQLGAHAQIALAVGVCRGDGGRRARAARRRAARRTRSATRSARPTTPRAAPAHPRAQPPSLALALALDPAAAAAAADGAAADGSAAVAAGAALVVALAVLASAALAVAEVAADEHSASEVVASAVLCFAHLGAARSAPARNSPLPPPTRSSPPAASGTATFRAQTRALRQRFSLTRTDASWGRRSSQSRSSVHGSLNQRAATHLRERRRVGSAESTNQIIIIIIIITIAEEHVVLAAAAIAPEAIASNARPATDRPPSLPPPSPSFSRPILAHCDISFSHRYVSILFALAVVAASFLVRFQLTLAQPEQLVMMMALT